MSREASRARSLQLARALALQSDHVSHACVLGYPIAVLYRLPQRAPLPCAASVAAEALAPPVAACGTKFYKE